MIGQQQLTKKVPQFSISKDWLLNRVWVGYTNQPICVQDEPAQESSKEEASKEPQPIFGPHPNAQAADFSFEKEVECLPLKLNLMDIPLDKEHQAKFIDLIYSNKEVFSLYDEDLDSPMDYSSIQQSLCLPSCYCP